MNLTLLIQGLSARSPRSFPGFAVPLLAQEPQPVVESYEMLTSPVRRGQISGTFTGESFFTAGFFEGTLTEVVDGCVARREFSGPITVVGLDWDAGAVLQACRVSCSGSRHSD
jgi:hypothetical protein